MKRVKIDDKASQWLVSSEVIQGKVLGQTFFLLFIADINEHITDLLELIKYANQILIYKIFKWQQNQSRSQAIANAELSKNNRMKINDQLSRKLCYNLFHFKQMKRIVI